MSILWLYDPDYCEGFPCYKDCDNCPVADRIFQDEEENDDKGD